MAMTSRISLVLEPDLRARAEEAARRHGENLSEFIRNAIHARIEPR